MPKRSVLDFHGYCFGCVLRAIISRPVFSIVILFCITVAVYLIFIK